ncbi:hypothetical protein L0938_06060 [Paracidovorax citrulli]
MESLVEIMKASLGPGVAALGVAVALAQWHTNQVKLRLDSYDRRLNVYKAVVAFLDEILAESYHRRGHLARARIDRIEKPYRELSPEVVAAYQSALLEAPFLFDDEISYFMRRVDSDRRNIKMYAMDLVGSSAKSVAGTSKELNLRVMRECENRMREARDRVGHLFHPYLKLKVFGK